MTEPIASFLINFSIIPSGHLESSGGGLPKVVKDGSAPGITLAGSMNCTTDDSDEEPYVEYAVLIDTDKIIEELSKIYNVAPADINFAVAGSNLSFRFTVGE